MPRRRAGRLLIGTSGYVYGDWRGRFYPRTLPSREWLPFYTEHFSTVELNNSFYRLPTADMFREWYQAVPRDFVFAVKASRFLTHVKRLKDPASPLRRFLTRVRHLRATLGPVLFQLPPQFHANHERLDRFLATLARQRVIHPLRVVLEVRHPSWLDEAIYARLRAAGVSLCLHDSKTQPVTGPVTADFVYVRRHGYGKRGNYPRRALTADARAIERWLREGRDVYVYFNNDWRGYALNNARTLAELTGAPGVLLARPGASR